MSELEKKDVNEMDAAEMLEGFCRENPSAGNVRREKNDEDWAWDVVRALQDDERMQHRRRGWEAVGMCLVAGLTVAACCAAVLYGCWKPIVMGIAAANLMLAGAWQQKAKEEWRA